MEKYFGYRPPQSDPVVIRQAESARRLRRASAAPQQCSRNAASTSSAEDCPLAASLNLAEIRSMIDLLRVATVLVSHCVRKHTRTSATQTSLRHPPSAPILSGLYVYNGRSDESGGYGTIPNAPSLTLAVGFRNENPPSNLHQHQCLQSLHTLITMRSCRGNFHGCLHRGPCPAFARALHGRNGRLVPGAAVT